MLRCDLPRAADRADDLRRCLVGSNQCGAAHLKRPLGSPHRLGIRDPQIQWLTDARAIFHDRATGRAEIVQHQQATSREHLIHFCRRCGGLTCACGLQLAIGQQRSWAYQRRHHDLDRSSVAVPVRRLREVFGAAGGGTPGRRQLDRLLARPHGRGLPLAHPPDYLPNLEKIVEALPESARPGLLGRNVLRACGLDGSGTG